MTKVVFYGNSVLTGFCIKGHSTGDANDETGRLVCSAVSASACMAANTITEIAGEKAEIEARDGYMSFKLESPNSVTETILRGFKLNMEQLAQQYEKNIKISSEV